MPVSTVRGLELGLGRGALQGRGRVPDREVDGQRQVERDHALAEQHGLHFDVLDQVAGGVADTRAVERRLVVARQVHEHEVVALAVEELRGPVLDLGGGHRLAAAPGLGERLARAQVLELRLHQQARAARRRRLRLEVGRLPGVAVDLQDVAALQLGRVHGHRCRPPRLDCVEHVTSCQVAFRNSFQNELADQWLRCRKERQLG